MHHKVSVNISSVAIIYGYYAPIFWLIYPNLLSTILKPIGMMLIGFFLLLYGNVGNV